MRAARAAFLLLALASGRVVAQPLELKGIAVDAPVDCNLIVKLASDQKSAIADCRKGRSFKFYTSFFDAFPQVSVSVHKGMVESVIVLQMPGSIGMRFPAVLDALTEKFGKPTLSRRPANGVGGSGIDSYSAMWRSGAATLYLTDGADGTGLVAVSLSGRVQAERLRDAPSRPAAKDNL